MPRTRVLVVEDSPTAREFLCHLLSADPALEVIGTAANGEEAVQAVLNLKPDAITMDINMPVLDGLEATRRIMESRPTPIVIVSAQIPAEESATFQAMQAGALAVIRRPAGLGHAEYQKTAKELIRTLKTMAEVKLVKRWPRSRSTTTPPAEAQPVEPGRPATQLVVMGGSTGAPGVFQLILKQLPKELSFPVVIVQHISPGFVDGFAQWLKDTTGQWVQVARHEEPLQPGHVYLAPDQHHLLVTPAGLGVLNQDPPEHGMRPAICALFRSAAYSFAERTTGVLLSGMGADGAEALKQIRAGGGLTIVQKPETAVISSMPAQAILQEAACQVLAPEAIAELLAQLSSQAGQEHRKF